jgi:phosphatidylserine/phosphatidylglycerophosphate/cardiolipin synthase-like enzyme
MGRDTDLVARLAAPLWARVGRTIGVGDLSWTRSLAGEDAPTIVWTALEEASGVASHELLLSAESVARLCTSLLYPGHEGAASSDSDELRPRLVWTLPLAHLGHASRGATYRDAIVDLVNQASEQLTLVSPFLDSAGIGGLLSPLLNAMSRGVNVTLLTHDALDLGSFTSRAIEDFRREADRVGGRFAVYSAEAGSGQDRQTHPLLHSKLVICDKKAVLIGSANLTSHALASNFEAGVLLGSEAALEVSRIVYDMINSRYIYIVFGSDQTP